MKGRKERKIMEDTNEDEKERPFVEMKDMMMKVEWR